MKDMTTKINEWMQSFVEVPNPKLGNFAPCPFARAARINNKIKIIKSNANDLYTDTNNCLSDLDSMEVVVIYFDHEQIDVVTLQETVGYLNKKLMPLDYVVLEDHPNGPEYVNGVKMNFGHCGLLIVQRLDQLNQAADKLRSQGYYDSWDQASLDSVVSWRYIHDEVR